MEKPLEQEKDQPQVIIEEKIQKINGETQTKKYLRGKMLGKGGFAKCYEITNMETKRTIAAKIIPKQTLTKNRARQKLLSEIKIHKSLQNPHIVQFEHVFEDQENVYILLEICTNNTLNELIKRRKRLTEIEVQCYLLQIIQAIKYLHQNHVIHRDLKLGNLFLSDKMEIKLGDFGLAAKLENDNEKKHTICGTPNYIAPEILEGKQGHSYQVDIWSLGVIIYTLLIGKPPFETPDVKTTYKKIRNNSYGFPENVPVSDAAKSLITKILNLDPLKRPTLEEILVHQFLHSGNVIPKSLPQSTLACPPSTTYLQQFYSQQATFNQKSTLQQSVPSLNNLKNTTQQNKQLLTENNNGGKQWGTMSQNLNPQKELIIRPQTTQKTEPKQQLKTVSNTNLFVQQQQQIFGNLQQSSAYKKRFSETNTENNNLKSFQQQQQNIWVVLWIDYSSKYGLGYILNNGNCGVYFNDSTKILQQGNKFEYSEKIGLSKEDKTCIYDIKDYPLELKKKVTLLNHFSNYLHEQLTANGKDLENQITNNNNNNTNNNYIYVKKWMKTKHAILFRLSNKIVQVCFTDKTEILLQSDQKIVTYVDKKGLRQNYALNNALESSNSEMSKRLKYTKDILTRMLNTGNKDNMKNSMMEGNLIGFEKENG